MKSFKQGSMMQEHRKSQASVEQAQRIFEHMINCLKIFLKLMRQIFNEAIYEGAPLYIVLDLKRFNLVL